MQDVPRESLGRHLGFGKDKQEGRDELDKNLAREFWHPSLSPGSRSHLSLTEHAKYVYNLQDTDTTTDESEGSDSWDSDGSTSSANNWRRGPYRSSSVSRVNGRHNGQQPHYNSKEKRRMSLLTGKYFDIPSYESGFEHYECGAVPVKSTRRRFFQSGDGKWDDLNAVDSAVNTGKEGHQVRLQDLAGLMERGGRGMDIYDEEEDVDEGEDEDEVAMSIDS